MSTMDDSSAVSTPCPSHFRLDQLAAGEIGEAESTEMLRHIEACAACLERKARRDEAEALHTTDLTLLRRLSARSPDARRARAPKAPLWSRRVAAFSAAAALGAFALVALPRSAEQALNVTPGTRSKGAAHSALYVADENRIRAVDDASVLYPGSTLQVTVTSPEPAHVAVASVDGAGRRTVYVPYAGEGSALGMVDLPAGHDVPLPQSTILDDVLGTETVAVFICRDRLADARLLVSLIDTGDAPEGCVVDRYTLRKQARP